ncbi:MAG: prepilin-type N-terminal cleavage/methylation domain-containing protein [Phycisphaerales bacterium]|nr:prepilin-type N-terminal cleavage/methylation domain-containing protein [Phycisphaerales bacterium]
MRGFTRQATRGGRGYTLIELLIVIGLLGLAAQILIPYLNNQGNLHLQAAVRTVIADLAYAQQSAHDNQGFRRVVFFADGTGYAIVRVTDATFNTAFDAATADYVIDPIEGGEYIRDFGGDGRWSGISIKDVDIDSGNSYVTYDLLGGTVSTTNSPGTGGSVTLTADGEDYIIGIEPFTGKVTVTKVTS